jgi:hypothetical protein
MRLDPGETKTAATSPGAPGDVELILTSEERTDLQGWLAHRLESKRIEEHRTDSSAFREFVRQEIRTIESILAKLS